MKLINKKTGEIAEIKLKLNESLPDAIRRTIEEAGWEETREPLIKDEKVRKAVRAWAEANDIEDGITYLDNGEFRSYLNTTIDFAILVDEHRFDLLKKSEEYTITELCGEEVE